MKIYTLLIAIFAQTALAATNQIPIHIGRQSSGAINAPEVSVTICEPGSTKCQVIDHILLDTGSVGLRIFASQIKLNLPALTLNTSSLAECMSYGGGDSYWGQIRKADMRIGSEIAANLRMQIIDQASPQKINCESPASNNNLGGHNGILGIGFGVDDCSDQGSDENCSKSQSYYNCTEDLCAAFTGNMAAKAVTNPIASFSNDNNGFIIEFPDLKTPAAEIWGQLTFGINSENNNKLLTKTIAHNTRQGWLVLQYLDKTYYTRVDSGTAAYYVPAQLGLPSCSNGSPFVCPPDNLVLPVSLQDGASASIETSIQINNAEANYNSELPVMPKVAQVSAAGQSNIFILGVPFMFGKRIYFGFPDGRSSKNSYGFVAF